MSSKAPGWEKTAIHELGHSAFGLADEYQSLPGCANETDHDHDHYTGIEPIEPNVTIDSNRQTIEWADFIDPTTPMPATANPDCARCDLRPSPVGATIVGAFEGARYFHCGLYRPQYSCMMNDYGPFCAVCTDAIRQTLSKYSGSPTRVDVPLREYRVLFDPSGHPTVSSITPPLDPPGTASPGFLDSGAFARAPAGSVAAGLFGYRYQVSLHQALGGDPGSGVREVSLDWGPIMPVNYDGSGPSHMFHVTFGSGMLRTSFVQHVDNRLIFTFNPPVSPGIRSHTFGLSSRFPAREVMAEVRDMADNVYSVPAKAPSFPPPH